MSLNKININFISILIAVIISAALIEVIPFISGTTPEDEVKPLLVINSIEFHKKIVIKEKKLIKKKPKIVKKHKKIVKKPRKKIKKQQKIVKKKDDIKPIEKNFSTKNKKIKKTIQTPDDEIPIPEPIYRVTEKPYFLREGALVYPEDMKRLGKTAIVIVDALIDRKGKVRKTTIYKSAGKSFNDAAINAIKNSLFVPGKISGKPVAVLYRLSMKFTLL